MEALDIPCPICCAQVGEMCAPATKTAPHLARVEEASAPQSNAIVVPIRRAFRDRRPVRFAPRRAR